MTMISDEKVQEVRSRAAILDIVSDYVRMKKTGANYQGLCPFHNEKTPSFSINPGKEIFHCFGCGAGGDVFAFIMKMEGLSFPEAVRFLAARTGVTIEDRAQTPEERSKADEQDLYYRISENAALFYSRMLAESKEGEPGRIYLAGRNIDSSASSACRLGFAPDRWDALAKHLEKSNLPLDKAEQLGLVRRRESGGFYDIFRNRLLFPISDPRGRCIAFGGRVLDDSLPKYLNSPESPVYHKGEVLYGFHLAKQAIREDGGVFLVEGYFDHLALFRAGFKNAVATCGTALTAAQVKLLKRHADKIYTLFDADKAGEKATIRAMDLFLEHGVSARVVTLVEGEDPDSFLGKFGVEAFRERVGNAVPIFEYFALQLCRKYDLGSVEGKVKVLEELSSRLARMENQLERDLYIKEVSRLVGVEENLLRSKLRGGGKIPSDNPPTRKKKPSKGATAEEMLLSLMGKYPEVAEKVSSIGVSGLFSDSLKSVAERILSQLASTGTVDWPAVLEPVPSAEEKNRLISILVDDRHLEGIDAEKAFDQCRLALERTSLQEMKALVRELATEKPGTERYEVLLREIDSLRNMKSRLF